MDTLLNLSDEEIEAINPNDELVLFDHIKDFYNPSRDLNISYLLGSAVVTSSCDWIGLFRYGWTSTKSYLTYQWAPQQDVVWFATGRRRVVIPQSLSWKLFNDEDRLQLLYVTSGGHVIGVSKAFTFGTPEPPELHFDVLESLSSPVEESFSNNFIDFPSLDAFALSSDSGNSFSTEPDSEDEDLPVTLSWDSHTLAGDFTGKSWYEELELLEDGNIVKEYDPSKEQSIVPYMPLLLSTSSTTSSTTSNNTKPISAAAMDRKYYSVFFNEDSDEDVETPPLKQKEQKSTIKKSPLSLALLPVYSKVPVEFSRLWTRHDLPQSSGKEEPQEPDERTPLLADEAIPLPFCDPGVPKQSIDDYEEIDLKEEGDGDKEKVLLYDINHTRAVAIPSDDKKRKVKEERVKMAMQIIKGLIAAIPAPLLPRPLSCASDCIACVVSRFMVGHYQQRLQEAEERAQSLECRTAELQKSLDAKAAADKPDTLKATATASLLNSTNVASMLLFVKEAEETIALLDEALALTLTEKRALKERTKVSTNGQHSGSEKSQQTDVKVIKDVFTECVTPKSNASKPDTEEVDGWKLKNSRKIARLKKTITRRNESLQQAQDVIKCQQGQINLYQDIIKELRRSIREERKHVKSGRQEILKLRRQVKTKLSSQVALGIEEVRRDVGIATKIQPIKTNDEPKVTSFSAQVPPNTKPVSTQAKSGFGTFSNDVKPLSAVSAPVATTVADSSAVANDVAGSSPTVEKATRVSSALAGIRTGLSPFYANKKAFRQDMNAQIKEGRCRTCGMNFSSKVDRRLIEEHIVYHRQFNH